MDELQFCLPDLGEGLTEGEVLQWLVAVGETVSVNQPLVEVETAKAAVELPSPYAGTVVALHAAEGDLLRWVPHWSRSPRSPRPAPMTASTAGGAGHERQRPGSRRLRRHRGVHPAAARLRAPSPHGTERPEAGPPGEPVKPVRHGGLEVGRAAEARFAADRSTASSVRTKPPVRRLAKQLGVDLSGVRPTGRDGTVTRDDVEAAAALLLTGTRLRRRRSDRRLVTDASRCAESCAAWPRR